jgi:hypothetical protein
MTAGFNPKELVADFRADEKTARQFYIVTSAGCL